MRRKEEVIITVYVQPNAKQSKVISFHDGILKLKVAAHPINDRANKELVKFLSIILGIRKGNFSIVKGATSRLKTVTISGIGQDEAQKQLEKYYT